MAFSSTLWKTHLNHALTQQLNSKEQGEPSDITLPKCIERLGKHQL